ncbi:MAG: hypothetical protein ACFCD0_11055 [Gemmataceae bacterium]
MTGAASLLISLRTIKRHGHVTDIGAKLLAECPEVQNLETLDLINNRLTGPGIAALEEIGINVRTEPQNQRETLVLR